MNQSIFIEIKAAPDRLMPTIVYQGSAVTFGITGVPAHRFACEITGVAIRLTTIDGTVATVSAVKQGAVWTATFPATATARNGHVANGVALILTGNDEARNSRTWIESVGDLRINALDPSATPGEQHDSMRWFDTQPTDPKAGDVSLVDGIVKLFNGSAWISLGGLNSVSWDIITGKPAEGLDYHDVTIGDIFTWLGGEISSRTVEFDPLTGALTITGGVAFDESTGVMTITDAQFDEETGVLTIN